MKELKERRDKEKKERAEKRTTIRANAEKYYKEYQGNQQSLIDSRRKAKA